ncbi:unnamed protein product [marine sediment metagenome]|uniref:Uncharacterized protein n=1 Tax=marine sediment metagenome TaxID=412755 RepID=X1NL85_9ZZZZ
MFSAATADLGTLEGRLTAARATALDELLAANIPTDLADLIADLVVILADVTGLAGAAMRGTDGVPTTRQFTPYTYNDTLADGASFIPPNKTIVFAAHLSIVTTAVEEFFFFYDAVANVILDAFSQNLCNGKSSISGLMYCEGTHGFRNDSGNAATLRLEGLTMA